MPAPLGLADRSGSGRCEVDRLDVGLDLLALVHDLDITILDATTGELLRELTLDPTRKYQPQQTTRPEP